MDVKSNHILIHLIHENFRSKIRSKFTFVPSLVLRFDNWLILSSDKQFLDNSTSIGEVAKQVVYNKRLLKVHRTSRCIKHRRNNACPKRWDYTGWGRTVTESYQTYEETQICICPLLFHRHGTACKFQECHIELTPKRKIIYSLQKRFAEILPLHVSGHATMNVLHDICKLTNPRLAIIPIHKEKNTDFSSVGIPFYLQKKIVTAYRTLGNIGTKIIWFKFRISLICYQ